MANHLKDPHEDPKVLEYFGPNRPNELPILGNLGFINDIGGYVNDAVLTFLVPLILSMFDRGGFGRVFDTTLFVACLQGSHEFFNWLETVWDNDKIAHLAFIDRIDVWMTFFRIMTQIQSPYPSFFTQEQVGLARHIVGEMTNFNGQLIWDFSRFLGQTWSPNIELFNSYLLKVDRDADAPILRQLKGKTINCPPKTLFRYNWNQPLMGLAFSIDKRGKVHVQTDPRYGVLHDGKEYNNLGFPVGTWFLNQNLAFFHGIHGHNGSGIHEDKSHGSFSVVMKDKKMGNMYLNDGTILYNKKGGSSGLLKSYERQLPLRVLLGRDFTGYIGLIYIGLYIVVEVRRAEVGEDTWVYVLWPCGQAGVDHLSPGQVKPDVSDLVIQQCVDAYNQKWRVDGQLLPQGTMMWTPPTEPAITYTPVVPAAFTIPSASHSPAVSYTPASASTSAAPSDSDAWGLASAQYPPIVLYGLYGPPGFPAHDPLDHLNYGMVNYGDEQEDDGTQGIGEAYDY